MTKSNLVPRPWTFIKGMVDGLWVVMGGEKNNVRIAGTKDEGHAEFITRACNCHDDLVAALKPFAQFHCEPLGSCDGRTGDKMCPNCEGEAALTKAKALQND